METLFQFCAGLFFFLNHSTFFVVCPVAIQVHLNKLECRGKVHLFQ